MAEESPDFKYIVRIGNADLDGKKHVELALTGVKGVGTRVASAVTLRAGVDRKARIGDLSDADVEKLQGVVETELTDVLPAWMRNRRKDIATGDDVHVIVNDLEESRREDLNRLKKIRCYRGVRHERGLPVRGQRTRSNNRKGLALGVQKQKIVEAAAAAKAEAKKEKKE